MIASLLLALQVSYRSPDPNSPATIELSVNELRVSYSGNQLLSAHVSGLTDATAKRLTVTRSSSDAVDQVWAVTARGGGPITIEGQISASNDAFACAADRPDEDEPNIVRNSVGAPFNALNRGVYDRRSDWVLSFDPHSNVEIRPEAEQSGLRNFRIKATGSEIILRFRPRYYQKHRGFTFFQPGSYQVWKKPVVGWCSWYAYGQDVDEKKMHATVDVLATKLKPYGLQYVQIDDGYQRTPVAFSDTWLNANSKFPSGLDGLTSYIHEKGLKAGVWSSPMFHDDALALANPSVFVRDIAGKPTYGRWVGYSVDGSNPKAIDQYIRPTYGGFKKQGWDYFKVDALRHLRYEGYNSNTGYFDRKAYDRVKAYRNVVSAIREEIGRDRFMLACWGIRPELVGIADACRIGDDGFAYSGLAQFNSLNNILWRNDPDHIELSPQEAFRSCMVTSLCGAVYMLTDKAERYATGDLEAAKRTMPTLFTLPSQLYDVDPSRSQNIARVDSEVSGGGPRPFDASRVATCDLFQLDIGAPFGQWTVLGRTGDMVKSIGFDRLGLDRAKRHHVFEFWSKRYLGSFTDRFDPGKIDPKFNCQAFVISEDTGHPQLLSTSRHVSGGAIDVEGVSWANNRLTIRLQVMAEEPTTVYVSEPEGATFDRLGSKGIGEATTEIAGSVRKIEVKVPQSGLMELTLSYK